jgi:hypothetical protein
MSIVSEMNDGVKCVEFTEVIKIDEGKVRQHVEEVYAIRGGDSQRALDAEADELWGEAVRAAWRLTRGRAL